MRRTTLQKNISKATIAIAKAADALTKRAKDGEEVTINESTKKAGPIDPQYRMGPCEKAGRELEALNPTIIDGVEVQVNDTVWIKRLLEIKTENFQAGQIQLSEPFKPVSKETIRRWIKHIMEMADINVEIFTPDSTRAASTSYAMNQGLPIEAKVAAAGWSQEIVALKSQVTTE
ncbi:hypothetical protein RRG08_047601 [Elysia crispata]|uniref:Uncharacterized protein n=1 Tax=Elysia crispata TaxID=231223 RepID=A0AAE1DNR8_9GAST|nr:hypothetical protein RRG08_047601 [Elysia crispata]